MDSATAALVGAAIGGGVAIIKSFVDSWSQRRLEKAKAEWVRSNAVETELRAHVATVARELLAAQHSMEWLCARTDGGADLSEAAVTRYQDEIHEGFPKLLGALATVSSVDDRVYRELSGLSDRVFELDGLIANALRSFEGSASGASAEIAKQRSRATELYRELPGSIATIMKSVRK